MANRRRLLKWAVAAGLVGLLSACGLGGGSAGRAADGVLRVVTGLEPASLNPVYTTISDAAVFATVFDPMVGLDEDGQPDGSGLLTEWEQVKPNQWVFQVRDGVTAHDGSKWTAEDAAFTLDKYANDRRSALAVYFDLVTGVKVRNGALEVTTSSPFAALPAAMANTYGLPKKYYTDQGGDGFAKNPLGTGPFEVSEYRIGQSLDVVPFTDYWGASVSLKGVSFTWSNEENARVSLVRTGQADLALELTSDAVEGVGKGDGLEVVVVPETTRMLLWPNSNSGPLADRNLRLAVAMAIDKKSIVDNVLGGDGGEVIDTFIGDDLTPPAAYDDTIQYEPDKARRLVGAANGSQKLRLTYTVGNYPADNKIGEVVAGMLESVGFEVKREPVDYVRYRELRSSGSIELGINGVAQGAYTHPDNYATMFVSRRGITKHCGSAEVDRMIDDARGMTTEDADKTYRLLEDEYLNQDACMVPMFRYNAVYAYTDRLKGLDVPRTMVPNYQEIRLE